MPALNFQERFADMIESGEKRQTIRPERKRPIKAWDTLYLYTGMRTKDCRFLKEVQCMCLSWVVIKEDAPYEGTGKYRFVDPDGFAQLDGFDSWPEMRDWFKNRYGLPFEGVLIQW